MWNSIRMELYKIFRMRSFWVISIIMIGLVFMTTEFNCDDMKAARQEQSASEGNVSGQEQSTSEGNVSGQEQSASEGNISGQQNKDGLQVSKVKKKDQANLEIGSANDNNATIFFGISEDTSEMDAESVEVLDMFLLHLKSGILTMMALIFAIMFVMLDIKNGYIKNIGGQMEHRRHLVYAKWIAMAIYTVVFDLISLAVQSIAVYKTFHYIKWGDVTKYLPEILLGMALQYVFLILCMTIAMLIRSMAFSMTLGMCLIMGVAPVACMGISAVIKKLFDRSVDLQPYLLTSKMKTLQIDMTATEIRNVCLLVVGYFVVMSLINIIQIEKRDLV